MGTHGLKVLAAALVFCAAEVNAQGVVTLVCSSTPDGPSSFQIVVNFDQSTLNFMGDTHQAQISDSHIAWQTPRHESGGVVRPAARFTVDRITGQTRTAIDCLPRDNSWGCSGSSPISYCKPAKKMF